MMGLSRRGSGGPADGARAVTTRGQRALLLAAFVLLAALRLPRAWAHGRFLDEEGTIFFAFAWHRGAGEALWRSFGGYLNLAANLVTLIDARLVRAGILTLEHAPYLTMTVALAAQALPAVLLLTGRGRWLASRWAVTAALAVIALAPRVEETYLNVLHIQFHLALAAALILALDVPTGRAGRLGSFLILAAAPLCGPAVIVLAPLFAARTLLDRDPGRAVQTAVLGIGAAIQLLLFFHPSPVRGHLLDPATIGAIIAVRLVALPILAGGRANRIGVMLHDAWVAGGPAVWIAAAVAALYLGLLAWLALRDRRDPAIWLVASGAAFAVLAFGGGMIAPDTADWFKVNAGERYNFLPLALLAVATVVLARRGPGAARTVARILLAVTLFTGVTTYFKPNRELRDGPVWPREVAAWRRDHDYPLVAWPPVFTVDLSDRDRPCTRWTPRGAPPGEPGYCEGAWLDFVRAVKPSPPVRPAAVPADRSRH